MKTFKRICIKDYELKAENGDTLNLKRGQEYTTSAEKDKKVVVFTAYWVAVPADLFAGEQEFTRGGKGRKMENPNNCDTCEHKDRQPKDGWCYMFRDEPKEICMQHTERRLISRESLISLMMLGRMIK